MLVTCDIGNTNIKIGLFQVNGPVEVNLFKDVTTVLKNLKNLNIDGFAVSSVVPNKLEELKTGLRNNFSIKPFIIDKSNKFNLKIIYDSFQTLGIDRICSAEGAFFLYNESAESKDYDEGTFIISIDCGTATTLNIIRFPGEFIGGIIAPGIRMMFNSLSSTTAQLPEVDNSYYKSLIAKDTNSSIASGVINSTIGLIEKNINYIKSEFKAKKIKIYVTGGNANQILPHINFDYQYEKGLVLYGIRSIYEKNI